MAAAALASPIRALVRHVVDYALPPRCPGCGEVVADDHVFCLSCWQSLDFLGGPACAQCGESLELALHDDSRCGACLANPPPFDRLRAAVSYGPIARALALKLKHGKRPGIAETMARLMRRKVGESGLDTVVAPVPLHRWRIWSRGYNQSALIAQALVRQVPATLALDLVERRKATPSLRGLGRAARARAVTGAFAISPRWKDMVRGKRVLLVDDVYTTGATARGCAKVLRRAGAAEIHVLCWARVVQESDPAR
jgi:ComF family protein